MDARKVKKFVLNNLAYVIFGYAGNIICFAFRTAEGKDVSEKILPALTNLGTAFAHILPSFNPIDLLFGVVVGVAMKFIIVATPFPQQAELEQKTERLTTLTDELNQAAIEAKKNAPEKQRTCYFERAKLKKEAFKDRQKPAKSKDKSKDKNGIE